MAKREAPKRRAVPAVAPPRQVHMQQTWKEECRRLLLLQLLFTCCQPGPNQISQVVLPEQDTAKDLFGKLRCNCRWLVD